MLNRFLRLTLWAALCALVVLLAGCGGGGGGGGSTKVILTYTTDWTNHGNAGGGRSQRIEIIDSLGNSVQTLVIDQDVPGKKSVQITLPKGTYTLSVLLFSGTGLGGILTGELQAFLTVNGATTFESAVGNTPTAVVLTPSSATLKVQQTKQFHAHLESSAGIATFNVPGDFAWSTLGGVATVDSNGVVLGTSAGSGSVRVTHTPSSLVGAATLTVQQFVATTTKWTVMIYLNAANDLDDFSLPNVNQMESVAGNSQVRFVVQWKQAFLPGESENPTFIGTRRYLLKPDTSENVNSELIQDMGTNVDMGSPTTLNDFISWTKTFYPAQRYVLVIWNHGNGWRRARHDAATRGVSYDDDFGTHIDTWQLGAALGNNDLDIVAWDASLMQMSEIAYEIQDQAKFIVGSEESPPGEGYPYDAIFQKFRDTPDATTKDLSKAFVDGMNNDPRYVNRKITQSVIDPTKLPALATAVTTFADALIANKASLTAIIPNIRAVAQKYETDNRYFFDLYDICSRLEASTGIPDVVTSSSNVRLAITNAIVWEGHNANSSGSHGIAIDFSPSSFFQTVETDYAKMRWADDTHWDEWLHVAP